MNQKLQNNCIRFLIYDGDSLVHTTEWEREQSSDDAPNALQRARAQHGSNYAYRIERTGDSKIPNPINMVRFQIRIGDVVFLSKIVPESEKDELLAALKSGDEVARLKSELGLSNLKSFEAAEFSEVKV